MEIFDVSATGTRGPVWGLASDELNATLPTWPPGEGTPEHVNDERDVLMLVVEGSGELAVEAEHAELRAGTVVVVPKGARRSIHAGPSGIRYLTVHAAAAASGSRPRRASCSSRG